jgi:uncharacterized protein YPO0396
VNERELQLLEGINVTVNLMRHEQQRHGYEIEKQSQRIGAAEDRLKRLDSVAPRALRSVSESVHEHDTEMAAVAVHMGEQGRMLAELRTEATRHAAELTALSKTQTRKLTGAVVVLAPIVAKVLDLLMTWRLH